MKTKFLIFLLLNFFVQNISFAAENKCTNCEEKKLSARGSDLYDEYKCGEAHGTIDIASCLEMVVSDLKDELTTKRQIIRSNLVNKRELESSQYDIENVTLFDKTNITTDAYIEDFCQIQGWAMSPGSWYALHALSCHIDYLDMEISKMEELIQFTTEESQGHFFENLQPIKFCEYR